MDFVRRQIEEGYIVIHHVLGDRDGIEFLRRTSRTLLERLVLEAKRDGQTTFINNDTTYIMTKNRDGSFSIFPEDKNKTAVI